MTSDAVTSCPVCLCVFISEALFLSPGELLRALGGQVYFALFRAEQWCTHSICSIKTSKDILGFSCSEFAI